MGIVGGGLINAGKGASSASSSQLALSDGLACYTGSFSGVSSTSISHGLDSTNLVVEFKDHLGNLLIPDTWSITNPNVIEVEFTPAATGDVTVIACIESGLAPITGGVTLLEGLSGIIDLDCPDGTVDISTSGQVINICANLLFTAESGALLEQKCEDIDTLSGLIGTPASASGQAFYRYDGASGSLYAFSTDFSPLPLNNVIIEDDPFFTVTSGDLALRVEMDGLYVFNYGMNMEKLTSNANTKIQGRALLNGASTVSGSITVGYLQNRNNANTEALNKEFKVALSAGDILMFEAARVTGNGDLTFMAESTVSARYIRE